MRAETLWKRAQGYNECMVQETIWKAVQWYTWIVTFSLLIFCDEGNAYEVEWSSWTACNKPCDIGTQSRTRFTHYNVVYKEERYCNLHYCPDNWSDCSDEYDCYGSGGFGGHVTCENGKCTCDIRSYGNLYTALYFNTYNCEVEYGNCIMRVNPPFALSKVDSLTDGYKMSSCITNDNDVYEVHMIGTYGQPGDLYRVNVRSRGDTSKKPIVIALSSYEYIRWIIDTDVAIYAVVYDGLRYQPRVTVAEDSECTPQQIQQLAGLNSAYGKGGNTISALQILTQHFGQITSFTGFYELSGRGIITLSVGGDPLQVHVLPKNNTNKSCQPVLPSRNVTFSSISPSNGNKHIYITTEKSNHKDSDTDSNSDAIVIWVPVGMCTTLILTVIITYCCVRIYKGIQPSYRTSDGWTIQYSTPSYLPTTSRDRMINRRQSPVAVTLNSHRLTPSPNSATENRNSHHLYSLNESTSQYPMSYIPQENTNSSIQAGTLSEEPPSYESVVTPSQTLSPLTDPQNTSSSREPQEQQPPSYESFVTGLFNTSL